MYQEQIEVSPEIERLDAMEDARSDFAVLLRVVPNFGRNEELLAGYTASFEGLSQRVLVAVKGGGVEMTISGLLMRIETIERQKPIENRLTVAW